MEISEKKEVFFPSAISVRQESNKIEITIIFSNIKSINRHLLLHSLLIFSDSFLLSEVFSVSFPLRDPLRFSGFFAFTWCVIIL